VTAVTEEREAVPTRRTRPVRILRALADSPVPLSTPELVRLLDEGIGHVRALNWYGDILRGFAAKGRVTRAGRTPGGWQRPPGQEWAVTEQGREWLAANEGRAPAAKARPDAMLPHAESVSIGRSARELRAAAGRRQRDVADEAGIARSVLGDFERGRRRIPAARAEALARVLGTTREALAAGGGEA